MVISRAESNVLNTALRRFFQKHYEFRSFRRYLERHHVDLSGRVVLDAGCGSGYSSELIGRLFRPAKLYAFDLLPGRVLRIKQRGLPANVSLFVGDIAATGLPAATFDAVFSFGIFHHVAEWLGALKEVNRILKPGGIFLGGEPSAHAQLAWLRFAEALARTGFRIVESETLYLGYFTSFMCARAEQESPPLRSRRLSGR